MSSLGNFPDWNVFTPRDEGLSNVEFISPAAEVASLLGKRHANQQRTQQNNEAEHQQLLELLAQQAVLAVKFLFLLERYEATFTQAGTQETQPHLNKAYRSLRILKDQMLAMLHNHGVNIDIPRGRPYDEVMNVVNIESWSHGPQYTAEVVVEVIDPIVFYQGKLLHRGSVVMGAPLGTDHVSTSYDG